MYIIIYSASHHPELFVSYSSSIHPVHPAMMMLMLQRQSKRLRRHTRNADSSYEAAADETSFEAGSNADGDNSDTRGNDVEATLDSYVTALLSDMGDEMFRSGRFQEVNVPELQYNSQTNHANNQVHIWYVLCCE